VESADGSSMAPFVVARFTKPASSARVSISLGSETRQPLACSLSGPAKPEPTDPLNLR
jgi:hypothetical protein